MVVEKACDSDVDKDVSAVDEDISDVDGSGKLSVVDGIGPPGKEDNPNVKSGFENELCEYRPHDQFLGNKITGDRVHRREVKQAGC